MDRVASITVLKDAAATAIYGSKAANGVIVVETKAPEAGKTASELQWEPEFFICRSIIFDECP